MWVLAHDRPLPALLCPRLPLHNTAPPPPRPRYTPAHAFQQRCVELLRRKQAGVATCLILEKQRHLEAAMNEKLAPPPGSERLFDLVRAKDARAKLAFWYALRNTLVVKDMDAASK